MMTMWEQATWQIWNHELCKNQNYLCKNEWTNEVKWMWISFFIFIYFKCYLQVSIFVVICWRVHNSKVKITKMFRFKCCRSWLNMLLLFISFFIIYFTYFFSVFYNFKNYICACISSSYKLFLYSFQFLFIFVFSIRKTCACLWIRSFLCIFFANKYHVKDLMDSWEMSY